MQTLVISLILEGTFEEIPASRSCWSRVGFAWWPALGLADGQALEAAEGRGAAA
jgi:hypothetical protein